MVFTPTAAAAAARVTKQNQHHGHDHYKEQAFLAHEVELYKAQHERRQAKQKLKDDGNVLM